MKNQHFAQGAPENNPKDKPTTPNKSEPNNPNKSDDTQESEKRS